MMKDSIAQYFRPINPTFLDKSWGDGFELYYKTEEEGQEQFLKYADYTPDVRDKILQILQEQNHQQLYIHETDLLKYYKQVLLKNLQKDLADKKLSSSQAMQKVYPIASRILSEYFGFYASVRILRALDDIPGILVPFMAKEALPFPKVYKLTSKQNHAHAHCLNVGLYCLNLGVHLNMSEKDLEELFLGGMLADIGKITIPEEILNKKKELDMEELHFVHKHPSAGRKILNDMKCYSESILLMAAEHHENFDGSGYPFSKAGDKISQFARICKIMDVFNALTSERAYHKPLDPPKALSKIKNEMLNEVDQALLAEFILSIGPK